MSSYSSTMTAWSWGNADIDIENPYFAATVTWTWPAGDYWSRAQLVRTVRSPAHRVEEGQPLLGSAGITESEWPDQNNWDGVPSYIDEQPPPGEWVFYSLFVLNSHRIWRKAGHASCIGPDNFGWSVRLPELLPGVSVSHRQGVTHPADQSTELVQFLQTPASEIDIALSYAEAMQFYWDPLRCPPQFLRVLSESWGYRYSEPIGMARNRAVLGAFRDPAQGSLHAIGNVVMGVMGSPVSVVVSNNLMLDQNDSSWESGDFKDTRWGPKPDPDDPSPPVEVRAHDPLFPPPVLAPNLMHDYFLMVREAGTWKCGYAYDEETGDWGLAPERAGIPISAWPVMRMGCYARAEIGSSATITLGMDIYDPVGGLLGTLTYVKDFELNTDWQPVPDPAALPDPIPIIDIFPSLISDAVFRDPLRWTAMGDPYANPQGAVTDQTDWMEFQFVAAPTVPGATAMFGLSSQDMTGTALEVGKTYIISAMVEPLESQVSWQVSVSDGADTLAGSGFEAGLAGVRQTNEIRYTHGEDQEVWVGVEAQQPPDGWDDGSDLRVQLVSLSITEVPSQHAYGVPWFSVSDACAIDVFIADDGEG